MTSNQPPTIPDHELLRCIGSGSYGEVWLARNVVGTPRAVKIVRRDRFEHAEDFEREFKGLQRFEPVSRTHEGLSDILTLGHLPGADGFFYVMELADAAESRNSEARIQNPASGIENPESYSPRTLRFDLKARGALPVNEVIELGLKLTAAVAHLHAQGLVHRDIKPSNILFVGDVPKLADAGLVAALDDARSLVGTTGYIAPEGPGSPQADLYALGKVLYEAAFGKDRQDFPQLPPDLRSRPDHARLLELNAVLLRACATNPRERYPSAEKMLTDLELLRAGRSVKRRQSWRRLIRSAGRFAVPAAVALVAFLLWPKGDPPTPFDPLGRIAVATIAVLPFDAESPGADDNEFNGRLTEEIRSGLTRVPALGVVGKSSSAAFKGSPDRLGAARSNKVSAVLEGRVRRTGENVRLSLELTDTRNGRLLWSEALTAPATDPFALQLAVLQRLPEALGVRLTESQRILLGSRPTQNLEAYRLYWEAKALIHVVNSNAFEAAIQSLTKAIELDPNFALAYCELADCYAVLAEVSHRPPKELWAPAKAAAQRGLDLAPDSSEAHISMGAIKETFDYDWAGAESEYRRAVQINPNNAKAHLWLGLFLAGAGRSAEARPHRERAMELDPLEAMNPLNLGLQLFYEGRHGEALWYYQKAFALQPHPVIKRNFGELYLAMGRDADALQAYEEHWLGLGETPEIAQELRAAFERSGWRGYWQTRLAQMDRNPSKYFLWHDRATFHDRLGNSNEVFTCLAKSIENREFYATQIRNQNSWKSYRADPRFKELLRMLNVER